MADPIFKKFLDMIGEDIFDADIYVNYSQETGLVQPLNWINNQTRLNQGNMNAFYEFIEGYANWVGAKTGEYISTNYLAPVIKHIGAWTVAPKDDNPDAGTVFNDFVNNTAEGPYSSTFGHNNNAKGENQFVLGKYNADDEDAVFIIGWGEGPNSRKNIATIRKDGVPTLSTDLVNKEHLDMELSRVKQLNQWIGLKNVTSAEFNNATEFTNLLNKFVKDTSPGNREPRNGDLVTVHITNPTTTDPQYDEIWIFLETNPGDVTDHSGKWEMYSTQQSLLNASKTVKGLVQIGENINVSDGLISVPLATNSTFGVVAVGKNIEVEDGVISAYQYWIDF